MSDPTKAHELVRNDPTTVGTSDVVFDCPHCRKNLAVDRAAAGHALACPACGKPITVPQEHKVVTLAEAPETRELQAKPQWEQELQAVEGALKESQHQRQEAGNFYRQHLSEANRLQLRVDKKDPSLGADAGKLYKEHVAEAGRQKLRVEKLDAKIKELDSKRSTIRAAHP